MTDKPTITQADRDAASEYRQLFYDHQRSAAEQGYPDLSKAFANHREDAVAEFQADKDRLDYLAGESLDLRCFPIPTGCDDADIGWRVIGHYMAEPNERIMGEAWTDNPRAAIDDAIANAALAQKEPVE